LKVIVGCCGFPTSKEKYYNTFKVVEVQQTFYKILDKSLLEKWRKEAPKDFEFTVKAFQGITHPITSPTWKRSGIKNLKAYEGKVGFLMDTNEVMDFWQKSLESSKILDSKIILIQLPPSFEENDKNIERAELFFKKISRDDINIAIEFRGWSERSVEKICKKYDLISCVDLFRNNPVYFSSKRIGYFRFHGLGKRSVYDYVFSEKELEWIREKIFSFEKELDEAYILFNNKAMFDNAKQFLNLINQKI
jgi:Uncharacterized conserved protein